MPLQISGPQGQMMTVRDNALSQGLLLTLERRYLYGLPQLGLQPTEPDPNLMANTRFLRIREVAHTPDLIRCLHPLNMQNVLSSFRDGSHSVLYVVSGHGSRMQVAMGLHRSDATSTVHTADAVDVLRSALGGNYPGIRLSAMSPEDISDQVLRAVASQRHVGAITGIPSLKENAGDVFVQGLERLTNSLRGDTYCLMAIAQPISEGSVDEVIQRCRDLGSEIHGTVKGTFTSTQGRTTTRADQKGGSIGGGLIVGAGTLLGGMLGFGPIMGMAAPALQGLAGAAGFSMGRTDSVADQQSMAANQEMLNKTAEFCEQILDQYVSRLQEGKNLGFWNVGIFLLAEDENTLRRGQGVIRAILSGESTYFEPMRALDLSGHDEALRDSLMQFRNPTVHFPPETSHPLGPLFQQLATPMNTAELSLVMGLPREEVPGLMLTPTADFGLNAPTTEGFELGRILYRGEVLPDPFSVPPKSLTKHAFITGITGSGKTNTCLALLRAAYEREQAPFMVIEPAKQEYRPLLADPVMGRDLQIFTLGDETTSPFRMNPFQFARGYPLLTHIDLLKAVFNSSFPMYASMPYILEQAILDVYTDRGWDLATSKNQFIDAATEDYTPYLPTMEDLYNQIDVVVERARYGQQLSSDISAALKARIKSLLIGGKGLMLNCPRSYPLELLFNRPTVMELKRVGDDAEKAFLMALLLINLYEYCETAREYGGGLQHLTLIEESHRLLKNIPASMSAEGANPRGKAVEMFSDILAEIREYGEGFIIVDQVPAKLTPDALKNTNLKIVHRIVAEDDRQSVGNAMNLSAEQKEQIIRLRVGQAVIHNEYLDKPILVQIHAVKDDLRDRFVAEIGPEGLRKRMADFQDSVRDIYRRFPGCTACDAPCSYLSDRNLPRSIEYEAFQMFLDSILVAEPKVVGQQWAYTEKDLRRLLARRFGGTEPDAGVLRCQVIHLCHHCLHERMAFYREGPAGHNVYIKMEGLLVTALTEMLGGKAVNPTAADAIVAWLDLMRGRVAVEPGREELGCRYCLRRCWYGFGVQRDLAAKSKILAERLKEASQTAGFVGNFDRLLDVVQDFAQEVTPYPVAPRHLSHLAYCYLANSGGKRSHILIGFQRAAEKRAAKG